MNQSEELIRCSICREWYSVLYENDEVVGVTPCGCIKQVRSGIKPLDELIIKLGLKDLSNQE